MRGDEADRMRWKDAALRGRVIRRRLTRWLGSSAEDTIY